MGEAGIWNERRITGLLLGLGLPIAIIGVVAQVWGAGDRSFAGSLQPGAPLEQPFTVIKNAFSPALSIIGWSRIMIGVIAPITTVLGLAMLTNLLREAGDPVLSWLGMVGYLLGSVFVVFVEVNDISGRGYMGDYANVYVILAFLFQAAYGGALLRTRLLPRWIGWATLVWNIGWLAWFYKVNYPYGPGYYPLWHFAMPLLIGIVLLLPGQRSFVCGQDIVSTPTTSVVERETT